ncbi:MAG: hypothetical protein LBQ89_07650 [Treponema sp.]|jgi:hypothetical protein|nr:hypothetical protein [Treponema sp.]
MKKCLLILSILLFSCTNQNQRSDKTPTITESNTAKPLIIGGKQYYGPILDHSGEKAFTLDDIDDIKILVLNIDPFDSSEMSNLDGIEFLFKAKNLETIRINGNNLDAVDLSPIEQFINITNFSIIVNGSCRVLPDLTSLKSLHILRIWDVAFEDFYTLKVPPSLSGLTISGENLHNVDLSVIETLYELVGLRLEGDITKLPNLTKLEKLRGITTDNGELASLEGIGAPNIRQIELKGVREIDSLAPLNNLPYLENLTINGRGSTTLRIADMSNLPNLKRLGLLLYRTKIDISGIENLSALEKLDAGWTEPFNIEGIGELEKLQQLYLNLISPQPSVEFLRNMPNLSDLYLEADGTRSRFPHETRAYQVLDVSPLSSLKKLQLLDCVNFIIKNISALDDNDLLSKSPSGISLWKSRLFDETEKSRHYLVFEIEKE